MGAVGLAGDLRDIIPGWFCLNLRGLMIQWKEQQTGESGDESASFHCATAWLCDLGHILNAPGP